MGLDITAYSHLVATDDPDPDIQAFAPVGFEHSTRGLLHHDVVDSTGTMIAVHGYAATPETHTFSFHAGSYLGHTQFRNMLAYGINLTLWDYTTDGVRNPQWPFYELIYFADNEGCIGPEAARDLADDFMRYESEVRWHMEHSFSDSDVTNVMRLYHCWAEAMRLARHDGLIHFH